MSETTWSREVDGQRCPFCNSPLVAALAPAETVYCLECGASFRIAAPTVETTVEQVQTLGRFRLLDRVGQGSFGVVWRARDTTLDRLVALKIPHAAILETEQFRERFRREAQMVARLRHPGIVPVHEVLEVDGRPVVVSDYIDGVPLKDLMETRRLTFRESASLVADIADALDYAHNQGLVHRDIKPANILISEDGRVKVGDFGIAKAAESADLTQEGSFIGTAKYLAPEQVEGAAVDGRTDLYSLGIVLYEMLCGQVPFEGDTSSATALARLHQDPRRPRLIRASIPAELEAVTMTLLEREPERRYPTATHARNALLDATGGQIPAVIDVTAVEPRPTAGFGPTAGPMPPPPPGGLPPAGFPGAPGPPPGPVPTPLPPQPESHVRYRESERNWLLPTFLLVLAAVSLVVAAVLIGKSGSALFGEGDDGTSTTLPAPKVVALEGANDFDPFKDQHENTPLLPRAVDGDANTFWESEYYGVTGDNDISWKTGVGIYVTIGQVQNIRAVKIDTPSRGWRMDVYVASEPADTLAGWGDVRKHVEDGKAGSTTIDLGEAGKGVEGKAVLLWFTKVGAEKLTEGDYKGRYVMRVNEIQVLG